MANSLNEVTLIGRLGQDPDIRATPSGDMVANLSIATTDSYKDKSGNWQDTTEWHKVNLWGYTAETAQKHLRKGSKVCIEGKLATRSYEKDGITRYVTEIKGNKVIPLDPKPESNNQQAPQQGGYGNNFDQSRRDTVGSNTNQYANNKPPYNEQNKAPSTPFQDADENDVPF
jgi:single-strand DNA-binding protein